MVNNKACNKGYHKGYHEAYNTAYHNAYDLVHYQHPNRDIVRYLIGC